MERSSAASLDEQKTELNHNFAPQEKVTLTPEEKTALLDLPAPELEQEESQPKRKKTKGLILASLGMGTVAASIYGFHWWQYSSTHQETDDAYVAGNIHPVSSRINGTVFDVKVEDNQLVHQGQLLVQLDPRDYQVQVQKAQAALQSAQRQANAAASNITLSSETTQGKTNQAQGDVKAAQAAISTAQAATQEAKTGIPTAQATVAEAQAGIPVAQAQVDQAQANLVKAQADYNRYDTLYKSGAVTHQQIDTAKAAYLVALAQKNSAQRGVQQAQAKLAQAEQGVAQAQAKLAQAQEGVVNAQAKLASTQGGLQQANAGIQQTQANRSQYEAALAAIAQAKANLNDAQLQLSYTNIVAPSDGRVGRKTVEVGQRVQPGQSLMSVVDKENWVVANFKETQMEKMHPGQTVEVKLDAFPNHPFIGHVNSFSPGSGATFTLLPPDNSTGNFTKIVQRVFPSKLSSPPGAFKVMNHGLPLGCQL